jgi:hypothetical protein
VDAVAAGGSGGDTVQDGDFDEVLASVRRFVRERVLPREA